METASVDGSFVSLYYRLSIRLPLVEISRDTGYFTATVDLSNEHFHFSPFPFYLFRQASLELAEIAMFDLIIPNLSFEIEFHLKFF